MTLTLQSLKAPLLAAFIVLGFAVQCNVVHAATSERAYFAGGCFWCTESDFEKVDGVIEAISGYTGGDMANPTYEQVSAGGTGHLEAVKVIYDPARISYEALLDVFWRHVDPTDDGGQFVDRGYQYRSAIFYASDDERRLAEASRDRLAASGRFDKPIVTEVTPLDVFYPAEDYHQEYFQRNPYQGYCRVVIAPKVAKFRRKYLAKLKQS